MFVGTYRDFVHFCDLELDLNPRAAVNQGRAIYATEPSDVRGRKGPLELVFGNGVPTPLMNAIAEEVAIINGVSGE